MTDPRWWCDYCQKWRAPSWCYDGRGFDWPDCDECGHVLTDTNETNSRPSRRRRKRLKKASTLDKKAKRP